MAQKLRLFSRYEFDKLVREHKTEHHARGLRSWSQFVVILCEQFAGLDSLRGMEVRLATQGKHLYHLGVKLINRPSLSYANAHRSASLFEVMFYEGTKKGCFFVKGLGDAQRD